MWASKLEWSIASFICWNIHFHCQVNSLLIRLCCSNGGRRGVPLARIRVGRYTLNVTWDQRNEKTITFSFPLKLEKYIRRVGNWGLQWRKNEIHKNMRLRDANVGWFFTVQRVFAVSLYYCYGYWCLNVCALFDLVEQKRRKLIFCMCAEQHFHSSFCDRLGWLSLYYIQYECNVFNVKWT